MSARIVGRIREPRPTMESKRLQALVGIALVSLTVPRQGDAQCPDGSPPPCRSAARADSNAFLVAPFVVRGPPEVQYLGASMVDLLHMALDGVGRMRIEYAPTNLRRVGELNSTAGVAALAVELGIGRVIDGTVVATGNTLRIRTQVIDAVRNRPLFAVEARATPDNLNAVIDSLAAAILARRAVPLGERARVGMAEYATRSPKALQAYLVARQLARRGDVTAASDSLKSALRQDDGFGLAYMLLHRLEAAQAGTTGISLDSIQRAARAHYTRFPERVQFILGAHAGYPDRAERMTWWRSAQARYPNDPDVAFHLADAYFHDGLDLGEPREAALAQFRKAIAIDDRDPELLTHYLVLLFEDGNAAEARRIIARCHSVAPVACAGWEVLIAALFDGADPFALAVGKDSLTWGTMAQGIVRISGWNPALGLAVSDSFAMVQTRPGRTPGLRNSAWVARSTIALARGRYALASAFLDSAEAYGNPRRGFRMLGSIASGVAAPGLVTTFTARDFTSLALRAWYAATFESADSLRVYAARIDTMTEPGLAQANPGMARSGALGVRGLHALRMGDTAAAIAFFRAARPSNRRPTTPARSLYPGALFPLRHAQIEAARGNYAAAQLLLADVYPMNEYVPFIGEAEELRGRVALAVGDTAAAKRHYANVLAVWKDADPVLQPRAAAVRELLARLNRQPP